MKLNNKLFLSPFFPRFPRLFQRVVPCGCGPSPPSFSRPGVEGVLEPVAEEVERDYGDEDQDAGIKRQQRRLEDQFLGVGQQVPPARDRWLDAEAEEAQHRFQQNHVAHRQGRGDDNRRCQVGQDMDGHDPQRRRALGLGGEDELAFAQRQRRAADQAGHRRPADQRDDDDDAVEADVFRCRQGLGQADLAEVERRQDDQQRQQRQRDHPVGGPHQERVNPAAVVSGKQSDHGADDRRGERRRQADDKRYPAAVKQPDQDIAADLVGAQRVRPTGPLKTVEQVPRAGVSADQGGGQRRRQRRQGQSRQHPQADDGEAMFEETPPGQRPHGFAFAAGRAHHWTSRKEMRGSSHT